MSGERSYAWITFYAAALRNNPGGSSKEHGRAADAGVEQFEAREAADEKRLADRSAERGAWRDLLVQADSMLSAYGHGRVITKDEALDLSGRCRAAYEKR